MPGVTPFILKDRHGFTLIEIVMVIVLLAVLVTIGVTQFVDLAGAAKDKVTRDKLNTLKMAIVGDSRFNAGGQYTKQGYESHCLGLPSTLTNLITKPGAGTCASDYSPYTKQGWRGPYVSSTGSAGDPAWNQDAWGTNIVLYTTGPPARTLRSCGPDKTCGNADDIDVTY